MCDRDCKQSRDINQYSYKDIEKIAEFLQTRFDVKPTVGIICGTGLGSITTIIQNTTCINYTDIPQWPTSTVKGHAGELIFGYIGPIPVMVMKGRFHFFEGYPLWKVTLPIRVMKLLGVTTLILSNAAGGINSSYHIGDIMLIKDHINFLSFAGFNPLRGPNEEKWGPRFVAINDAYDKHILKLAKEAAKESKIKGVQEGVYAAIGGPCFETIAELRALKMLGADCVGMSTVHEVIAARHCGIKCFAFSLVTNKCGVDYESELTPNHEEILTVGKSKQDEIKSFVGRLVQNIGNTL